MLGNAMSKQSYERYWKIGANARIPCPVNLLKTNCTSPSLKQTRLQHSLRKKAVVQKPNDNQLKCGPLQHTPALSFKPHPNSATNLTKPSWPFVFQQHPVQWDAWSFLNAAPLKRQGVHFTFQKVTHISFSHCSETVQIIQVCILNNLNIYIYIYDTCVQYDVSAICWSMKPEITTNHPQTQKNLWRCHNRFGQRIGPAIVQLPGSPTGPSDVNNVSWCPIRMAGFGLKLPAPTNSGGNQHHYGVGWFQPTPSEKYESKWESSPNRDENRKICEITT